jgi:hypothetical protein
MIQGSITGIGKTFLQNIHTDSGPHTAYYSTGTGDLPQAVKVPENEADHPPLSNAEVKNGWSCTSTSYVYKLCFIIMSSRISLN